MILSGQQKKAVERTGQDVCVVAGPGSGKTRVLVERFAWLVETRHVPPEAILAITFTEKAATEIKQRLVNRFADQPELRERIERAWVSTIDGFCTRLLQENAIAAGLAPDFNILDQPSAERLARQAAEEALEELYRERPDDVCALLEAVDLATAADGPQSDLAASLLEVYETMRLAGVSREPLPYGQGAEAAEPRALASELVRSLLGQPPKGPDGPRLLDWAADFAALPPQLGIAHFEVLSRFHFNLNQVGRIKAAGQLKNEILPALESQWVGEWYGDLKSLLAGAVTRIDRAYRAQKRQQTAVDFADLAEYAIQLLESQDDSGRESCARFQHVLMDELQDTNRLQWRLVDLVRRAGREPACFFGVGDVNQSIYGFRHADREVFAEYRAAILSTGGIIDELDENYRSRAEILDAVERMLDGKEGIESRQLTSKREFEKARGPVVELLLAQGDSPADTEAAVVAARILGLVNGDLALVNPDLALVNPDLALVNRDLEDGGRYQFSDIAVLLRTLTSTTRPFEQAFDRAGIPFLLSGGRTFLEARETRDVLAFLAALVNPLDEIALITVLRSPLVGMTDEEILREGREGWQRSFEERFGRLRRRAGFQSPDRLIAAALDECGYLVGLPMRARANIDKLLAWLRREHRNHPRPLAEMLEDLEGLRSTRGEAEAPPPEAGNVVRMMSIHAAKGLEFPVVFVSALNKGARRDTDPLLFSPELGLGVKWRNPATAKAVPDPTHAQLGKRWTDKNKAEESRLLYVASTRAEELLTLSAADSQRPTPWLKMARAAITASVVDAPPEPRADQGGLPAPAAEANGEQVLDPPLVMGQYDSSAAVTSVAIFHACPRKYYLSRYLGLEPEPVHSDSVVRAPEGAGPGTGAIELGLEVHRALAGEAVDSVEALELKARFEGSDLGRRAARATHSEREFDFQLLCEDVILRGQIDLWFEEAGELVLVDYKTDRDDSGHEAYALQLRLYALALARYAGRLPDRAVLYYLRPNRAVDVDLSDDLLRDAQGVVRALRHAQETLVFPLREGEQCGKCVFYGGLCPAGRVNP